MSRNQNKQFQKFDKRWSLKFLKENKNGGFSHSKQTKKLKKKNTGKGICNKSHYFIHFQCAWIFLEMARSADILKEYIVLWYEIYYLYDLKILQVPQ